MPYPINTLPYPFKKRLRQLLTPVELYQLQNATGPMDENHYLLPLIKRRKCYTLNSTTTPDNELVIEWLLNDQHRSHITETSSYVYQPVRSVILQKFHESHLSDPKFHHIIFDKLYSLEFHDTIMTESLLSAFAKKQIRVTDVKGCFHEEQYPDGFHRIPAFVAAFPAVTNLKHPCSAYKGWLQDLSKLKKYDLEDFSISSNSFEKLFSFHPKEMLKFIKRQSKHNEDFSLHMDYYVNDITPIELERIQSLFEPYFEQEDSLSDCHLSMCILTVPDDLRDWYYFKLRSVSYHAFAHFACAFNFQQRHVGCSVSI